MRVATASRIYPLGPIEEGAYLHNHDREPKRAQLPSAGARFFTWDPIQRQSPNHLHVRLPG